MNLLKKSLSDVVIVSALRTPVTRSNKGGLAAMFPEELLATILRGTIDKTGLDGSQVDDILVGTVLQKLGGQKTSALAVKATGFPATTTVNTINRQCSSSAQAAAYVANSIRAGDISVGLAAGVESMTHDYFPHRGIPERVAPGLLFSANDEAKNVLMPMGTTSENVAKMFDIPRELQDAFAKKSHEKAANATNSGHFLKEIVPVNARELNSKDTKWVQADDGIRISTMESLAKLKPVFSEDGRSTAGNSSQISDGASATLLMTRERANELGLKPIAKYVSSYTAGVPSDLMGIGPAKSIPVLLRRQGLTIDDVDILELNEAYASQSIYCIEDLGIPYEKVNPFGGAIAIGHPLGATGGRLIATLVNGLHTLDKEVGVVSMCTSTGQGFSSLILAEN